jgi:hypothetical protein
LPIDGFTTVGLCAGLDFGHPKTGPITLQRLVQVDPSIPPDHTEDQTDNRKDRHEHSRLPMRVDEL